ncbi:MAG TPA: plasmid pRiA4b ORF-3 family protein [Thermodesulfobacteriota bacterium]|jgi:hypothetical protein|nr:plasmid pRiA4b ORF-3 family protein [Thermodesulfobacteriota bacterium]
MKKKFGRVFQFKITLKDIKPPIWRRIQVPESYTFWDLHVAIQDAMGWFDSHLHRFEILNPSRGMEEEIGIPDEECEWDTVTLPGWKQKITDYFSMKNTKSEYVYDFGDNWEHIVKLEKILPRLERVKYPICIGGKRACPPEDSGGPWGYEEFLEAIMNPKHREHEEMLDWVGGNFDPEHFDIEEVEFENPNQRLKYTLG